MTMNAFSTAHVVQYKCFLLGCIYREGKTDQKLSRVLSVNLLYDKMSSYKVVYRYIIHTSKRSLTKGS